MRPPKSLKCCKSTARKLKYSHDVFLISQTCCECFSFLAFNDLDLEYFKDLGGSVFVHFLFLPAGSCPYAFYKNCLSVLCKLSLCFTFCAHQYNASYCCKVMTTEKSYRLFLIISFHFYHASGYMFLFVFCSTKQEPGQAPEVSYKAIYSQSI